MRRRFAVSVVAAACVALGIAARGEPVGPRAANDPVDAAFAEWTASTPGCAIGVAVDGKPVLQRAYGMADLEHGVANTPATRFEAGSVSKQFTAAAILLLAHDGKLSLDDAVRKYLPEVPDFGAPLTIRHMLTHTSGLRDWGNVEAIAGWPRTTRAYTQAHVLDIVSRQRAVNFPPGTRWSYSNTGYNLAAMIVARVSGETFPAFTRERIFEPLGMAHTGWRDDHTRIEKGRAMAYERKTDGYHTLMPFEDVYGNAALLTTVGDLLKWNENFASATVGGRALVDEQQQPGHFTDGRAHNYAFGLMVGEYKGVREVSHTGSTAGYRAFLTRYPDQHVSLTVLCNAAEANAEKYGRAVADQYLGRALKPATDPPARITGAEHAVEGLYRNTLTGVPLRVVREGGSVKIERVAHVPFLANGDVGSVPTSKWTFDAGGAMRSTDPFGTVDSYEPVAAAHPTVDELRALAGTYVSDEAEVTYVAAVDGDSLVLKRRPDTVVKLMPIYADAFVGGHGIPLVIFRRDGTGRPTAFSVVDSRVWDLRFARRDRGAARQTDARTQVPVEREPHHHVVLTTAALRILDININPGDMTLFHAHAHDMATVCISGSASRGEAFDAEDFGRTGPPCQPGRAGVAEYTDKPATHRLQNAGDRLFRLIAVENLRPVASMATDQAPPVGKVVQDKRAFRITELRLDPGQSTAMHAHARSTVVVVADGRAVDVRAANRDGQRLEGPGRWTVIDEGASHALTNSGMVPATVIELEIK